MPADLDSLFDELGRQADALPTGGVEQARRRGRQRTHTRTIVSAAVAVVLIVVGGGLLLRPPEHEAAPVPLDGRPLPAVGVPIDLDGTASTRLATDSKRVYTAGFRAADTSVYLKAVDLGTGVPVWERRATVDPRRALEQVVVAPSAVLVITRSLNGTRPAVGMLAFDPATGRPLWTKVGELDDDLVFMAGMLVRRTEATGRVEGFDWVSGATRWSRRAGDRAARAVGMGIRGDEARLNRSGPSPVFGGDRVVILTDTGKAEVYDAATGRLDRTVPAGAAPGPGRTVVAYDGWLYTGHKAGGVLRIRVTDLAGEAGTAVVKEFPGGLLHTMAGCGADRVCVVTESDPPTTVLTAIDARQRRVAWQATSASSLDQVSSAGDRTLLTSNAGGLALFDARGRLLHESGAVGGWLDATSLLSFMTDGSGRAARVSASDGRLTPYDRLTQEFDGVCTSGGNRLACANEGRLRIWKLS